MAKFKNKITKKVIEENLNWYVNLLRNNPCYEELKDKSEVASKQDKEQTSDKNNNQEEQTEILPREE